MDSSQHREGAGRLVDGKTISGIDEARLYVGRSRAFREELSIPKGAAVDLAPLGQGEHNANFTFAHPSSGVRYVLRVNYASQLGLDNQVAYEATALRALEPCGRAPKVLLCDDSREAIDRGVLVEELRTGALLDFHNPAMVREAARVMADVHALRPEPDCGLIRPNDPLRAQYDTCRAYFNAYLSSGLAEPHVVRYVREFFARTAESLEVPFDAAECTHVVNTEAVPSHFLIPIDGEGNVCGRGSMLDWEKPVIGEVAQDVAYFLSPTTTIWDTDYIFDEPAREAFIREYWRAVGGRFSRGGFDERLGVYTMSNCLLGITWSCNAWVEYHDPARPLKNDKTFELLKTYLSEPYLEEVKRICF